MNVFDKKFKKKVKHYSHQFYIVQYAHYRFIPNWADITSSTIDAESWDVRIFTKKEAELFIEEFKTIDDIRNN